MDQDDNDRVRPGDEDLAARLESVLSTLGAPGRLGKEWIDQYSAPGMVITGDYCVVHRGRYVANCGSGAARQTFMSFGVCCGCFYAYDRVRLSRLRSDRNVAMWERENPGRGANRRLVAISLMMASFGVLFCFSALSRADFMGLSTRAYSSGSSMLPVLYLASEVLAGLVLFPLFLPLFGLERGYVRIFWILQIPVTANFCCISYELWASSGYLTDAALTPVICCIVNLCVLWLFRYCTMPMK
jgi:hypothetical protein